MKKRTKEPWMAADEFGRSLPMGVGINLLVDEIEPMAMFCRDVLGATLIYSDEDFAAVQLLGSVFMLHADHSYRANPMAGVLAGLETRGAGLEIRLYGADPDRAEALARQHDHIVLSGAVDKPHGLRECHLVGPCGYIFVPSVRIGG
ncbi:hypothetical protein ABLE86_09325 [Mesorhizobium sp. KR2-14]